VNIAPGKRLQRQATHDQQQFELSQAYQQPSAYDLSDQDILLHTGSASFFDHNDYANPFLNRSGIQSSG